MQAHWVVNQEPLMKRTTCKRNSLVPTHDALLVLHRSVNL